MDSKNVMIVLFLVNMHLVNSFVVVNKNKNTIAVFCQSSKFALPFYKSKYGVEEAEKREGFKYPKIIYVKSGEQANFWSDIGSTIWFVDFDEGMIYDTSSKLAAALDLKFHDHKKLADNSTVVTVKRKKVSVNLGATAKPLLREELIYKINSRIQYLYDGGKVRFAI